MVASPEPEEAAQRVSVFVSAKKDRSRPEVLVEIVFDPLGRVLTRALLPLRVPPPAVVLANGAAGLLGAAALSLGEPVAAAVLLQLKTVLDNADGRLARASGRTSVLGRYLDTEVDFVVNAALWVGLAHVAVSPWMAVAGFCALTLVLGVDFNAEVAYRRAHGESVATQPSAREEGTAARALERVYALVYGPQDRLLQNVQRRRLERILDAVPDSVTRARATLAYNDAATLAVLANLGLSTQLALLGLCLVLGVPETYLWIVLGLALVLLPFLQVRRERLARRALA